MDNVIPLNTAVKAKDPVWAAADTLREKAMELTSCSEDGSVALVMAATDTALETEDHQNIAQMAEWLTNVAARLKQEIAQ
ncbi:MAG: hypothetical protein JAY90_20150 [Candidatus Thiodiazotropha lotti]|nr:hypothetical protein [Candidatus Thiodiazotropha lotti]